MASSARLKPIVVNAARKSVADSTSIAVHGSLLPRTISFHWLKDDRGVSWSSGARSFTGSPAQFTVDTTSGRNHRMYRRVTEEIRTANRPLAVSRIDSVHGKTDS